MIGFVGFPRESLFGTGWHHVAMTIDGAGVPSAYLDGYWWELSWLSTEYPDY